MDKCNKHHILFVKNSVGDYQAMDAVCGKQVGKTIWYCCKEHMEKRVQPDLGIRYTNNDDGEIMND